MVEFNSWLIQNANTTTPPLALVDTTDMSVAETVAIVAKCIGETALSAAGATLE